jgi:hypothetical protein
VKKTLIILLYNLTISRKNGVIKLINLDIKKEIFYKLESGKSVADISAECGKYG